MAGPESLRTETPLRIVAHDDEEYAAKMGDGECPGQ
jgi:hypothetical protein